MGEAAEGPSLPLHVLPTPSPRQALPRALSMETLIKSPLMGGTSASRANAPTSWPNPAATQQVGPWRCLGQGSKVRTAVHGSTEGGRKGPGVGADGRDARWEQGLL